MKKEQKKKKSFKPAIAISDELHERLIQYKEKTGVTSVRVVDDACNEHLDRKEREA